MSKVCFGRTVRFRASHYYRLPGENLAKSKLRFGESADPHVHDWSLTLWLEAVPDPLTGMAVDLVTVDEVLHREVVSRFHQACINDAVPYFFEHQPTTESLAVYFAELLSPLLRPATLVRVRVAESEDLFAEWHS